MPRGVTRKSRFLEGTSETARGHEPVAELGRPAGTGATRVRALSTDRPSALERYAHISRDAAACGWSRVSSRRLTPQGELSRSRRGTRSISAIVAMTSIYSSWPCLGRVKRGRKIGADHLVPIVRIELVECACRKHRLHCNSRHQTHLRLGSCLRRRERIPLGELRLVPIGVDPWLGA